MPRPISEAPQAIRESAPDSSIYVGCDSIRFKKNGKWFAKYATVVVLHRGGRHGAGIFFDLVTIPDYGTIKQRMLNEVMYSVQHASDIVDAVGDRHFEIHLDINPNPKFKSNPALSEAMGWVRGQFGDVVRCKPDAPVATHVADHFVRSLNHVANDNPADRALIAAMRIER